MVLPGAPALRSIELAQAVLLPAQQTCTPLQAAASAASTHTVRARTARGWLLRAVTRRGGSSVEVTHNPVAAALCPQRVAAAASEAEEACWAWELLCIGQGLLLRFEAQDSAGRARWHEAGTP